MPIALTITHSNADIAQLAGVTDPTRRTIRLRPAPPAFATQPAQIPSCSGCSDGSLAGDLGGGSSTPGTLTFDKITAQTAGTYQLRISYINGDSTARTDDITVDGGTAQPVGFPTNGSWTTLQNRTVTVTLQAGTNTIELSNPNGWAASLASESSRTPPGRAFTPALTTPREPPATPAAQRGNCRATNDR